MFAYETVSGLFFLGLIVVLIILWVTRAPLASNLLTRAIGVPVSVNDVGLSSGGITLKQFAIHGPKGSAINTTLSAEAITFSIAPLSIVRDKVIITNLNLDQVLLTVELVGNDGKANNWAYLFKRLSNRETPSNKPPGKQLHIDHFVATNLKFEVQNPSKNKHYRQLPEVARLEFKNIDIDHVDPLKKLARMVLFALFQAGAQKTVIALDVDEETVISYQNTLKTIQEQVQPVDETLLVLIDSE